MITNIEIHNNIEYCINHYLDTTKCYDLIKTKSEEYWSHNLKKNLIENYDFSENAKKWALGPMLKNNLFTGGYTILNVNKKATAFGGIRHYDSDICIIASRLFCFFSIKPIVNGCLVPFHLKYATKLGYKKAWITINDSNLYWYNTWYRNEFNKKRITKRTNEIYINSDAVISSSTCKGKKVVNNVEQTILEWNL